MLVVIRLPVKVESMSECVKRKKERDREGEKERGNANSRHQMKDNEIYRGISEIEMERRIYGERKRWRGGYVERGRDGERKRWRGGYVERGGDGERNV